MDMSMNKKIVIRHQIIYSEHDWNEACMLVIFINGIELVAFNAVPMRDAITNYDELKKYRFQFFSTN
jgi:type I site-specific restriction-modification system R (restriction) subunit